MSLSDLFSLGIPDANRVNSNYNSSLISTSITRIKLLGYPTIPRSVYTNYTFPVPAVSMESDDPNYQFKVSLDSTLGSIYFFNASNSVITVDNESFKLNNPSIEKSTIVIPPYSFLPRGKINEYILSEYAVKSILIPLLSQA